MSQLRCTGWSKKYATKFLPPEYNNDNKKTKLQASKQTNTKNISQMTNASKKISTNLQDSFTDTLTNNFPTENNNFPIENNRTDY